MILTGNLYIITIMHRKFILFLAVSLILGSVSFSFAQQEEQKTESESPAPAAQAPEEAKTVTAIEIKGNKAISTNTIISKMKTHMGSVYNENIISDDLKRLYLLGFFSDIKMDTVPYKDGLKVIFTVVERPVIEKISFSGIARLTMKDEKIKQSLKSKETQYLDYPSLAEDVRALKKLYEKIGYGQADVSYQVSLNKDNNKANVQFNVVEGRKITVKKIFVQGNKNFKTGRILGLLKTKQRWLFNAGLYKEEVLKEDIERVKAFYHKEGFVDVAADSEVRSDDKRPYFLYVTIKIEEGKKYLVGNVTIEGNKNIPEKDVLARLSQCVPGKVFSQDALKQDVVNIQGLYFDRGYIAAQIQEASALNSATSRVDVVYNITENDINYVDKIKIRGNVKTKDVVIRRELRIHPGDKFDGDKLKRSKERLQNLGFFDEVSYDTEETQAPDKKNLMVDVKETKTGSFSFGGGYSTVDQFVGFVEIEQKNFDWKNWPYFTGGGQDLRMRASMGSVTTDFDLSYTDPWVFDYPVTFGFDVYKRSHDRDTDVGYGYSEDVIGGDLRLGKELSEYVKSSLTYRLDNINIKDVSDNASQDLKDEKGKNTISSLELGLGYDSRDNVFDTKKGDILSGSLELAGGPFAGSKNYLKFFSRASHYFPMFRNSVIEFRGRLGLSGAYGNSEKVPMYERFFAGGAGTIRGYHERMAGPVDPNSKDPLGGDALLVGNIEYTYPLFDFLKVAAFYDVGNVWQKIGDIGTNTNSNGVSNSGGFKSGIGLGVRVKTPIGPITLDYGIPLNKEPGEDTVGGGKFHFSASHGF